MSDSDDSDEDFLLPGTVVGDRYRICEVLAWGGMGIVYRALHVELGSEVAVKTMRRQLINDDDAYERFVREARNTALLKTSHVAKVFDFGRAADGRPYLVMELLHGDTLGTRMKRGALTNEATAKYLIQACSGLADAHARGIVHRDLKPDNLFLSDTEDRGSELKLLDFGVAKSAKNPTPYPRSLTLAGGVVGSPSYMAPEQMYSRADLDQRADIWALGAVAYEVLAGVPAFGGETVPEICAKVLTVAPRPLRELRADVWPELEAVISRCLEREPEQRFPDVHQLSQALDAALEAHEEPRPSRRAAVPVAAPVSGSALDCVAETDANLDVSLELSQISGLGKRRWPRRLALLTALCAVAAGAWIYLPREKQPALYRRATLECLPVPVFENDRPAPAAPASVVEATQPILTDAPRAAAPVSNTKRVREYAPIAFKRTVEPQINLDAAVYAERAPDSGTAPDSSLRDGGYQAAR